MTPTKIIKWLREDFASDYKPANEAAALVERLVKENAELKRDLAIEHSNYKELASHHNRKCTCMEIY